MTMYCSRKLIMACLWALLFIICRVESLRWPATKISRVTKVDETSFAHVSEDEGVNARTVNSILAVHRGGGSSNILEPQSNDDLDQLLVDYANDLVVIDFYSTDCVPCQKIAPLFHEMSETTEFANRVKFVKINVDHHPRMAAMWNVTGWPTILFIQKGQVQTEIVGGKLVEATLYDWIKLFLPKKKSGDSTDHSE